MCRALALTSTWQHHRFFNHKNLSTNIVGGRKRKPTAQSHHENMPKSDGLKDPCTIWFVHGPLYCARAPNDYCNYAFDICLLFCSFLPHFLSFYILPLTCGWTLSREPGGITNLLDGKQRIFYIYKIALFIRGVQSAQIYFNPVDKLKKGDIENCDMDWELVSHQKVREREIHYAALDLSIHRLWACFYGEIGQRSFARLGYLWTGFCD